MREKVLELHEVITTLEKGENMNFFSREEGQ
jgi:hypothetical protein